MSELMVMVYKMCQTQGRIFCPCKNMSYWLVWGNYDDFKRKKRG